MGGHPPTSGSGARDLTGPAGTRRVALRRVIRRWGSSVAEGSESAVPRVDPRPDPRPWAPSRWRVRTKVVAVVLVPLLLALVLAAVTVGNQLAERSALQQVAAGNRLSGTVAGLVDALQIERSEATAFVAADRRPDRTSLDLAADRVDRAVGALRDAGPSVTELDPGVQDRYAVALARLDGLGRCGRPRSRPGTRPPASSRRTRASSSPCSTSPATSPGRQARPPSYARRRAWPPWAGRRSRPRSSTPCSWSRPPGGRSRRGTARPWPARWPSRPPPPRSSRRGRRPRRSRSSRTPWPGRRSTSASGSADRAAARRRRPAAGCRPRRLGPRRGRHPRGDAHRRDRPVHRARGHGRRARLPRRHHGAGRGPRRRPRGPARRPAGGADRGLVNHAAAAPALLGARRGRTPPPHVDPASRGGERGRGGHRRRAGPDPHRRGGRGGGPRVRPRPPRGRAAGRRAGPAARQLNALFVNLSRRSQGLVERQLLVIDPSRAGRRTRTSCELFALDHLATRLRRNGENLLVLARLGAGAGWHRARAGDRPDPRGGRGDRGLHARRRPSRAGRRPRRPRDDLTHLLAELLDNATTYSPPARRWWSAPRARPTAGWSSRSPTRAWAWTPTSSPRRTPGSSVPSLLDSAVPGQFGLFVVGARARQTSWPGRSPGTTEGSRRACRCPPGCSSGPYGSPSRTRWSRSRAPIRPAIRWASRTAIP